MPRSDWRSPEAHEPTLSLDAPGFAFEFLRRNAEFVRHHQRLERLLKRNALSRHERETYARRWGARFRESRARLRKADGPLDGDDSAECRPAWPATAQP
jgi:hypothetical protein